MASDDDPQAIKPAAPKTFNFFGLPRELRDMIYKFYAQAVPQKLAIRMTLGFPQVPCSFEPAYEPLLRRPSPPVFALLNQQARREYLSGQGKVLVLSYGREMFSAWHELNQDWHKSPQKSFQPEELTCLRIDYVLSHRVGFGTYTETGLDMSAMVLEMEKLVVHYPRPINIIVFNWFSLNNQEILITSEEERKKARFVLSELDCRESLPNLQTVRIRLNGLTVVTSRIQTRVDAVSESGNGSVDYDEEVIEEGVYNPWAGRLKVVK